ncbi:hypothetical protein RLOC_00014262, partial [Lonchura striata]
GVRGDPAGHAGLARVGLNSCRAQARAQEDPSGRRARLGRRASSSHPLCRAGPGANCCRVWGWGWLGAQDSPEPRVPPGPAPEGLRRENSVNTAG